MSDDSRVEKLIAVLKGLDPEERERIHEAVYEEDDQVSEDVRRNLSDFDDLLRLKENFVQGVVRQKDLERIATALQGARDQLKELFFKNMSSRQASMLRDEIRYANDVDEVEVQDARGELLQEARGLVENSRMELYKCIESLKDEPEHFESTTESFRETFLNLDDESIRKLLREIEQETLLIALEGADSEVKNAFYENLSDRAASMIKEELQYSDPNNKKNIEKARQKLVRWAGFDDRLEGVDELRAKLEYPDDG